MFEIFRRASVQFNNASYEQAACQVLKSSRAMPEPFVAPPTFDVVGVSPLQYTKNLLNLLVPPRFAVEC
jgi:hypothetical protein